MMKRVRAGMGWAVVATISMSTFHLLAKWLGVFPAWPPTPAAVVRRLFGNELPHALIIVLAVAFHFGYGAFWGGALWSMAGRVTIPKGVALGVFLWFVMQVGVFPFLGWGIFARGLNPKIAAAALVEHLVFGVVLGWLGTRSAAVA